MPSAANTEVVVAVGSAPIVRDDIAGAKKASLDDAMKNALGLVIGVYVSQESLVSKVLLMEDTIRTQTKGFIKRYSILQESQENGFYKTAIRAEIRKDDLFATLNTPALQPRLHATSVRFSLEENVDGEEFFLRSAQNAMRIEFANAGFVVTESADADIVISGKAAAELVSDAATYGFISYRAVLSLTAARPGSAEVIAAVQETEGGADVTREAAANAALVNAAKKAARGLKEGINRIVQDRSVIRLEIVNVDSMTCLNKILRSLRSLADVKDCRVRTFSGGNAQLDLETRKGSSFDIARHLEQMTFVKITINKAGSDDIRAVCLFNNEFFR
jgi:hypothetical protein